MDGGNADILRQMAQESQFRRKFELEGDERPGETDRLELWKKFMTLPNSPNEHFLVLESEGVRPRPLGEEASDSKRQSMSEFDLLFPEMISLMKHLAEHRRLRIRN